MKDWRGQLNKHGLIVTLFFNAFSQITPRPFFNAKKTTHCWIANSNVSEVGRAAQHHMDSLEMEILWFTPQAHKEE